MEMDMWHAKAEDARLKDAQGLISGSILDVPIFDQLDTPVGVDGSVLCWATCISMYIAYELGDQIDRKLAVAMVVYDSTDPEVYAQGGHWISTNKLPKLSEMYGLKMEQNERKKVTLSEQQIWAQINNRSKPFVIAYTRFDEKGDPAMSHVVMGVGYASAVGHEGLVITNDPAGGIQRIQTYSDLYRYAANPTMVWENTIV